MWDQRYRSDEYAYGTEPNVFFREVLNSYPVGSRILFPADGEGRNSVYAASLGHEVHAFDLSKEARKKALKLADKQGVTIDYTTGDFANMDFKPETFDAAALIFAHFPADLLSIYHNKIGKLVKTGGFIILEGFSKQNLPLREQNPAVGGPANPDMLFSAEQIQRDFLDFKIILLKEVERELNEGRYHNGTARLIRFIGQKTG